MRAEQHRPGQDTRWREIARCREVDADAFFPDKGQTPWAAKRVCAGSPVRAECLTDALNLREDLRRARWADPQRAKVALRDGLRRVCP